MAACTLKTTIAALNEQREITHFVAVKQDITERKQAEDRLSAQDLLALSKAERAQRQLAETLTAANQALTQSLNLETVLETLLEYVARLVPYDNATDARHLCQCPVDHAPQLPGA
jgi:signal transduction histidine kinase